jgi:competence protein ComEC
LEEFNKTLDKLLVPSLPLTAWIFFSTVFAYGSLCYSPHKALFTIIFAVIFIVSVWGVLNRYRHLIFKGKARFFSIAVILILLTSIFFIINRNIYTRYNSTSLPQSLENFYVAVDEVEKKRYTLELHCFLDQGKDSSMITLFYNGSSSFVKGDRLMVLKRVNKLTTGYDSYRLRGIHYVSYVDDEDFLIIDKSQTNLRDMIREYIKSTALKIFPEKTASVVLSIFTGNQSYIKKETRLKFRDAGALHILAASGLHVAIIAGIPAFLFFIFSRNIVLLISALTVGFYLFVTDAPISLVRATIMYSLFVFQIFIHRKVNSFNTLMITAAIVLLIFPWEIFSIGFQLSFGATLGIILFSDRYGSTAGSLPLFIRNTLAMTLSAQLFTTPIILFHLNQINTISVISNLFIIPAASFFMYSAFFALLVGQVPFISIVTGVFADYSYKLLEKLVEIFSSFNMNFFISEGYIIILSLFTLSLLPLIPVKTISRLKFAPVVISFALMTFYLKGNLSANNPEGVIKIGSSLIEYSMNNSRSISLDIKSTEDIQPLLDRLRALNGNFTSMRVKNLSYPNLRACKILSSEFPIVQCSFCAVPDITNTFKSLLKVLDREGISLKFEIGEN